MLRRSENALKATDEALRRLNPQDSTLQALTQVRTRRCQVCVQALSATTVSVSSSSSATPKVMSEDLNPEKMREDNQDGESLSNICVQSFRDRWWNKILATGVLETDGRSVLDTAGR